jgi:hypothetical protein
MLMPLLKGDKGQGIAKVSSCLQKGILARGERKESILADF